MLFPNYSLYLKKLLIKKAKKITVAPYSALAGIYDFVMNHVDYRRWANYVALIAQKHGDQISHIVDFSCGTGSLCVQLEDLGYQVSGCDSSIDMIKVARQKLDAPFWCADMRHVAMRTFPDMIVSLYDSMNYLPDELSWRQSLKNAYSVLKPGGLFLFDVSTLHNSIDVFKNYVEKEKSNNAAYLRKSRFDKTQQVQINYFEIRYKKSPENIFCETHKQKIRKIGEIREMIHQTEFEMIGCYSGFSLQPGNEESERVHFVLKK